jgi:hypothetical protein
LQVSEVPKSAESHDAGFRTTKQETAPSRLKRQPGFRLSANTKSFALTLRRA